MCLWTGLQRLTCDGLLVAEACRVLRSAGRDELADWLAGHMELDDADHDCGSDVWTGEWPGAADARLLGWFTRWTVAGWQRCDPDYTEARPDMNRLVSEARWDRLQSRWVLV